jgi:hypothetical protein
MGQGEEGIRALQAATKIEYNMRGILLPHDVVINVLTDPLIDDTDILRRARMSLFMINDKYAQLAQLHSRTQDELHVAQHLIDLNKHVCILYF